MLTLLRYRRPDFDGHTFEEQLDLLDQHRGVVNAFLKEQREHVAFLEYGTSEGIPRAGELARDQVKAALLADVENRPHREIANKPTSSMWRLQEGLTIYTRRSRL
jgi:hypothetical protein